MVTGCVLFELMTEYLNIVTTKFGFKELNSLQIIPRQISKLSDICNSLIFMQMCPSQTVSSILIHLFLIKSRF
jgi:hypothetical protein